MAIARTRDARTCGHSKLAKPGPPACMPICMAPHCPSEPCKFRHVKTLFSCACSNADVACALHHRKCTRQSQQHTMSLSRIIFVIMCRIIDCSSKRTHRSERLLPPRPQLEKKPPPPCGFPACCPDMSTTSSQSVVQPPFSAHCSTPPIRHVSY